MDDQTLRFIIDATDRSGAAFSAAIRNVERLRAAQQALGSTMRTVTGAIGGVADAVTRVGGLFRGLLGIVATVAGGMIGALRAVVGVVGSVISAALSLAGTIGGTLLRAVTSVAGAIGGTLVTALTTVAGVLRTTAIGAAVGFAGALGLIARQGISVNQTLLTTEMALTTMLRSQTAARSLLAALRQEAKTSAFEFVDLAQLSKRLLAFGFSAREIIPVTRVIGDTAAALGGGSELMSRIILALGQMRSAGVVQGDELRQLAEAGIPVFEILGIKPGRQKTPMPASEAIPKLLAGLRERFGGLQSGYMRTLPGAVSNMRDVINELTASVTVGLFQALSRATMGLTQFLDSLQRTAAGQVILGRLRQVFDMVGQAVIRLVGLLPRAAQTLAQFLSSEQFDRWMRVAQRSVQAVIGIIGRLIAAMPRAINAVVEFLQSERWARWQEIIWQIVSNVWDRLRSIANWLIDNWPQVWETTQRVAVNALKVVGGSIVGVIAVLRELWQSFAGGDGVLQGLGNSLKEFAVAALRTFGAVSIATIKWLGYLMMAIAALAGYSRGGPIAGLVAMTATAIGMERLAATVSKGVRGAIGAVREFDVSQIGDALSGVKERLGRTRYGRVFGEAYAGFGSTVDTWLAAISGPGEPKGQVAATAAAPTPTTQRSSPAPPVTPVPILAMGPEATAAAQALQRAVPGAGIPREVMEPPDPEELEAQQEFLEKAIAANPQYAPILRKRLAQVLIQRYRVLSGGIPARGKGRWQALSELQDIYTQLQEIAQPPAAASATTAAPAQAKTRSGGGSGGWVLVGGMPIYVPGGAGAQAQPSPQMPIGPALPAGAAVGAGAGGQQVVINLYGATPEQIGQIVARKLHELMNAAYGSR